MNRTTVGCSAALLVVGCAAVTPVHPPAATMGAANALQKCVKPGTLDLDNDGIIEVAEWNAFRISSFSGWDITPDGRIGPDEFLTCWMAARFSKSRGDYQRSWQMFDADRSGFLEADEFFPTAGWAAYDLNRDGRIDRAEWRRPDQS